MPRRTTVDPTFDDLHRREVIWLKCRCGKETCFKAFDLVGRYGITMQTRIFPPARPLPLRGEEVRRPTGADLDRQMAGLGTLDRRPAVRLTLPMISDQDIWLTAGVMIKRYGETADFEAYIRADEFSAKGDRAGMRVWLRILDAIDRLHVQPGELKQ